VREGLFADLYAQLAPDALEDGRNRVLWETCADLTGAGRGIDLTTVHEALLVTGNLAKAGGVAYLTELATAESEGKILLTPETISAYLAQFRDRQIFRARERFLRLAQSAAQARDESELLKAQDAYEAERAKLEQSISPPQPSTFERMYTRARELPPGKHLPYGRWQKEVEFRPGQLALIAARPGAGKTSFLLQLCYSWLRMPPDVFHKGRQDELFLFFGYETPEPEIHAKLLALAAKLAQPQIKFPSGPLDQGSVLGAIIGKHDSAWSQDPYWSARQECDDVLRDRFYAYHETDWTARQIAAESTRVTGYTKRRIGAVFVDYLQLVPG
jgi:replicative DNA helicase